MEHRKICSRILLVLLLVSCLAGCIWIVFEQVRKYIEKVTFVAGSYTEDHTHTLDLVFCTAKGFKDGPNLAVYKVSRDKYMQRAVPNNVALLPKYFSGPFDYTPINPDNIKTLDITTRYNGLCRVFQMKNEMSPKSYYIFRMPKNETYLLTITAPNEYIFLMEQQWPDTIRDTVEINSDCVIEFEKHTYNVLSKSESPCNKNENISHFIHCFREKLWQHFQEYKCLSHMFQDLLWPIHQQNTSRICLDGEEDEMEQQYKFYASMALNLSKRSYKESTNHCMIPCTLEFYNPYISRSKVTEKVDLNLNEIYISSAGLWSEQTKEMYLYDATAIVASVGGGIGIFLGFSCYGLLSKAIAFLQ